MDMSNGNYRIMQLKLAKHEIEEALIILSMKIMRNDCAKIQIDLNKKKWNIECLIMMSWLWNMVCLWALLIVNISTFVKEELRNITNSTKLLVPDSKYCQSIKHSWFLGGTLSAAWVKLVSFIVLNENFSDVLGW